MRQPSDPSALACVTRLDACRWLHRLARPQRRVPWEGPVHLQPPWSPHCSLWPPSSAESASGPMGLTGGDRLQHGLPARCRLLQQDGCPQRRGLWPPLFLVCCANWWNVLLVGANWGLYVGPAVIWFRGQLELTATVVRCDACGTSSPLETLSDFKGQGGLLVAVLRTTSVRVRVW